MEIYYNIKYKNINVSKVEITTTSTSLQIININRTNNYIKLFFYKNII